MDPSRNQVDVGVRACVSPCSRAPEALLEVGSSGFCLFVLVFTFNVFLNFFYFLFFLAVLRGLGDVNSPTGD